jgi:hypothetical protein
MMTPIFNGYNNIVIIDTAKLLQGYMVDGLIDKTIERFMAGGRHQFGPPYYMP